MNLRAELKRGQGAGRRPHSHQRPTVTPHNRVFDRADTLDLDLTIEPAWSEPTPGGVPVATRSRVRGQEAGDVLDDERHGKIMSRTEPSCFNAPST
jgi:hypothetical protein